MLDHIGLAVSDLGRSRRFYEAALAPLGIGVIMEMTPDQTESGGGAIGDRRAVERRSFRSWLRALRRRVRRRSGQASCGKAAAEPRLARLVRLGKGGVRRGRTFGAQGHESALGRP
jgi:catechol 2,3-dioxygenase-like lactoylglutathione lyase family enzyme